MRTTTAQSEISLFTYSKAGRKAHPLMRYEIDVSQLRDPNNQKVFSAAVRNGTAEEVQKWIQADSRVETIVASVMFLGYSHIKNGGASFISIGLWDNLGRWIAPAIGEIVATKLDQEGFKVALHHSDLLKGSRS